MSHFSVDTSPTPPALSSAVPERACRIHIRLDHGEPSDNAGSPREPRPGEREGPCGNSGQWTGVDRLVERAKQQPSGWRSIAIPPMAGSAMSFTIDHGSGGEPQKRGQLVLDRNTGNMISWEPFASNNAGRRLRLWSRFVHTGEAGGWFGQAIATIASAGAALLVWTGFALSWRRFAAWRARRARSPAAVVSSG